MNIPLRLLLNGIRSGKDRGGNNTYLPSQKIKIMAYAQKITGNNISSTATQSLFLLNFDFTFLYLL